MFAGRKRAEAKKKKLGKSKSTDTEEEEGDDDQDDGELYFSRLTLPLTRILSLTALRSKIETLIIFETIQTLTKDFALTFGKPTIVRASFVIG